MNKKCTSCGGAVEEIAFGRYRCPYCGSEYSEGDFSGGSPSDLMVFSALNKAREAIELEYDFKNSLKFSQSVLEKNPASREANWLAMLAENQIAYIQNEEGKYAPTFLAPDGPSLQQSVYYKALDSEYKSNADGIEKMRLATLKEVNRVKPYDVFISYRQHDADGNETKEAVWARDIYTELKTNPKTRNLNIFFDQKSLSGSNAGWEPHIYAAIRSSKCMILLGSSLDNVNSRWVKNEWKRFLFYADAGENKEVIVLRGEAVNPMLLDDALRRKQMISNTSGKWLDEITERVTEICVPKKSPAPKPKPAPAPEPAPAPAPAPSRPSATAKSRKPLAIILVCVAAAAAAAGITFGAINCNPTKNPDNPDEGISTDGGIEGGISQNGFILSAVTGGYSVAGTDGTLSGEVTVPAEYDGQKVISIAAGAFSGSKEITSLTVPDSVTSIAVGALEGLNKLTALSVPFVGISEGAENGYEGVLGAVFGYETWVSDDRVGSVYFNDPTFTTEATDHVIDGKVIQYATNLRSGTGYGYKTTYYYYGVPSRLKTVKVTKQEEVPSAAFQNIDWLEKAAYDKELTKFGAYSFRNCKALTSFNSEDSGAVDVSGAYRSLGEHAFDGCEGITKITFGTSIKTIGDYAFAGLKNITEVTVPDNVTEIGLGAFEGAKKLRDITLPFVGKSEGAENGYEGVLGYIFGYETWVSDDRVGSRYYNDPTFTTEAADHVIDGKVIQYATNLRSGTGYGYKTTYYYYGVPQTLKTVTVTKQEEVPFAAFYNLDWLTAVTYKNNITKTGEHAFDGCGVPNATVQN